MVAYAVESSRRGPTTTIAEGVAVRDRQKILSIPDLKHMQVQISVHESVVNQIRPGLPVTVRLDAFPDRHYDGEVESVSVLPDQGSWYSSDTKVYKTIIKINEEVDQLKPGMTAAAELHIDHLYDVLCIPVQALVQRGEETWCYAAQNGRVRRQPVELGQTNDKFVEVCAGLQEGDTVILNPTAVVDPQRDSNDQPAPAKSRQES